MKKTMIVLGVLLTAMLAWGAVRESVDKGGSSKPTWFDKGIYVGTNAQDPAQDIQNKMTAFYGGRCDLDYPSIPSGYSKLNPNPCLKTQAKIGDTCDVAALNQSDGGNPVGIYMSAYVRTTGQVEIDLSNQLADGGAWDPTDSGYLFNCESHQ